MVDSDFQEPELIHLPLLPLRDVVVYPHMVIPLFVGREKSIAALEQAMESGKEVMLLAQRNPSDDDPGPDDLYQMGTISSILQLLKLPDGTVKVLVEGKARARVMSFNNEIEFYSVEAEEVECELVPEREADALVRSAMNQFEQYVNLSKKVPAEVMSSLNGIDEPGKLADTVAAHMSLELHQKQELLEVTDIRERLEHLLGLMESEIDLFQVEKKIRGRVKKQMEKSQREYYLNEQMKAIQKELGEIGEEPSEQEELEQKIADAGMPEEAEKKTRAELAKLKMMSPMSAEASVVRAYIDWMVNVPWSKRSKVRHDLARAEKILERDHYGLEEVKERILEYLAVQKRVKKIKGPVLCLVGPLV